MIGVVKMAPSDQEEESIVQIISSPFSGYFLGHQWAIRLFPNRLQIILGQNPITKTCNFVYSSVLKCIIVIPVFCYCGNKYSELCGCILA